MEGGGPRDMEGHERLWGSGTCGGRGMSVLGGQGGHKLNRGEGAKGEGRVWGWWGRWNLA